MEIYLNGHIHQYLKVEGWDLFSNQQMGLEAQKNLGLLM